MVFTDANIPAHASEAYATQSEYASLSVFKTKDMVMTTMCNEHPAYICILGKSTLCSLKVDYVNQILIIANTIGQDIDHRTHHLPDGRFHHKH